MALFDKLIDLITEDDLASLIENQVREGYQIEYKQAVAFKDKQDKLDFLAGVTSFANTVGGDFLIGITAASGVPTAIPGWEGIDVDQEKAKNRVAIDRIKFAIRHSEQFAKPCDAMREAEMQLLDALQRLEALDRRFQARSRIAPPHQNGNLREARADVQKECQ